MKAQPGCRRDISILEMSGPWHTLSAHSQVQGVGGPSLRAACAVNGGAREEPVPRPGFQKVGMGPGCQALSSI